MIKTNTLYLLTVAFCLPGLGCAVCSKPKAPEPKTVPAPAATGEESALDPVITPPPSKTERSTWKKLGPENGKNYDMDRESFLKARARTARMGVPLGSNNPRTINGFSYVTVAPGVKLPEQKDISFQNFDLPLREELRKKKILSSAETLVMVQSRQSPVDPGVIFGKPDPDKTSLVMAVPVVENTTTTAPLVIKSLSTTKVYVLTMSSGELMDSKDGGKLLHDASETLFQQAREAGYSLGNTMLVRFDPDEGPGFSVSFMYPVEGGPTGSESPAQQVK